jgi:hypothetical protein
MLLWKGEGGCGRWGGGVADGSDLQMRLISQKYYYFRVIPEWLRRNIEDHVAAEIISQADAICQMGRAGDGPQGTCRLYVVYCRNQEG